MNEDLLRRLGTPEMKFLKSVARYTLIGVQRNEVIREEPGVFILTDKIADFSRNCMSMSVGWIVDILEL